MKTFHLQYGIGKAKYLVNFHNGVKTHGDGSKFFDCKIFKNKIDLAIFCDSLRDNGYKETNH